MRRRSVLLSAVSSALTGALAVSHPASATRKTRRARMLSAPNGSAKPRLSAIVSNPRGRRNAKLSAPRRRGCCISASSLLVEPRRNGPSKRMASWPSIAGGTSLRPRRPTTGRGPHRPRGIGAFDGGEDERSAEPPSSTLVADITQVLVWFDPKHKALP